MKNLSQKLAVLIILVCMGGTAQAQNNHQQSVSQTQNTVIQSSQTSESTRKAQQWNLQPQEWQRYEELMDGPLGIYSPGLDPLTALGISARSDEERRHYAQLQVMAETQRVERELAYQRAYDEAFKRMYPNLLPVDLGVVSPAAFVTLPSGNGRIAVFVRDNCAACNDKVQELQLSDVTFDLYMVGSNHDDAVIRRWATHAGIDAQKVFSRTITLNHDAGHWQSLGVGGDLPAVVVEKSGRWVRQ